MAASKNAAVGALAAFNLLVDLLVKCENQLPAKNLCLSDFIQEQMCLELSLKFWLTCFFSTERRKKYSPCSFVLLELIKHLL